MWREKESVCSMNSVETNNFWANGQSCMPLTQDHHWAGARCFFCSFRFKKKKKKEHDNAANDGDDVDDDDDPNVTENEAEWASNKME